jgi:hypothetical protein
VVVLKTYVLVETDDSGKVEGLILPLILLVELKVLELAGVLEDILCDEAVDKKTVKAIVDGQLELAGVLEDLPHNEEVEEKTVETIVDG